MNYIGELKNDKGLFDGNKCILIYGTSGYGEKIYRNLCVFNRDNAVKAFIDDNSASKLYQNTFHGIPIINMVEATEKYNDFILCMSETVADEKELILLQKYKENIHIIDFNVECERWGTEYGGFYVPRIIAEKPPFLVYSFGIGEDLSFSEEVIARGGVCYAFDPTPKAIQYVKEHKLFSNPRFHFSPVGLSDKDGMEDFYLPIRTDYVSASVINHKKVNSQRKIQVQMKTLRTIMRELNHNKIDILKMDIEGSEFKVVNEIMSDKENPIDFRVLCVETHERFFENRECLDNFYQKLQNNGFYDCYGTVREPTFIKCK